jgi:4-hydroxybenzoate polyprenyltransferase
VKPFYDQEPITGFIIIAGTVNALLGGMNASGPPFLLGLTVAGGSIAYRWWMLQKNKQK